MVGIVHEAGEGGAAYGEDFGVFFLYFTLLFLGDRPVMQRRAPVRRALEDGQLAGGLGDLLNGLYAGGAGADHGDALAFEADRPMRPGAGVVGLALEVVDAVNGGHHRFCEYADRGDQKTALNLSSFLGLDLPDIVVVVEMRRPHRAVEIHVAAQIELVGDEVAVAQGFGLGREMLRPFPFLKQFLGEGIAVAVAFGIEARARIAVPVPGTADIGTRLDHARRHAELAQAVQHVHAGDSGPDDDHVVIRVLALRRFVRHIHIPRLNRGFGSRRDPRAQDHGWSQAIDAPLYDG